MTSDVGGIHLPESLYGPCRFSIQYSVMVIRGNGVTLRTQKVIQAGDNGHVGRPCEVSLAPPCPEPCCRVTGPLPSLEPGTEDMWQK